MFNKLLSVLLDHIFFVWIPYKLWLRIKLLYYYYKIFLKNLFFWNFLKKETIFWYNITASKYKYIYWIFIIAFFKWQYYFDNKYKKDLLILDCWANIWVTSLFFDFYYPNSEIHTFEPNNMVFDYLVNNTKKCNNLTNHKFALSDENGKMQFFINDKDIWDTNASLNHKTNSTLLWSYEVEVKKLSDFIKTNLNWRIIDFIKFNIEWSEDLVIKDLYVNDCLKYVNRIIFEYHHHVEVWVWSRLSEMLGYLEKSWMNYTFSVTNFRLYKEDIVQNLFIYAYKKDITI